MHAGNEFGSIRLGSGREIIFRSVKPDDEELIAAAFATASRRTLLHRFFIPLQQVSRDELRRLLAIDPAREFCLIGKTGQGNDRRIVCGARYVRLAEPTKAEIALTVHDEFQHQGLGRCMLEKLVEIARRDGIRTFVAHVLATNEPMLHLIAKTAPTRRACFHSGECEIEFDLDAQHA